MKHVDYKGICLFKMETCVAVARFSSITKAAVSLHTSQPALSKKIAQIENELGCALFIRGKNTQLRPTPVGQFLCAEWDRILIEFRNSIDSAMDIQNENSEHLALATTPSAQMSMFIHPLIADFRRLHPTVELRVDNCGIPEAKELLCNKTVDVVLVNPFLSEIFSVEELEWEMIGRCPLSVGMLKTNLLAEKECLTIQDLKSQEFVLPQDTTYIRQITDMCLEKGGFQPNISYYAKFFHGISMCIGRNNEIFFTDKYLQSYYDDNCAFYDLPDTQTGIMLARRKHETNKYVDSMVAVVKRKLATK